MILAQRLTATVEAAALAALLPHPPALRHLRMRVKVDAPPVLWLVPHQHRSERDLTASAATAAVTTAAIDVVVAGRRPTAAAAALRRPIVSGAPATTATVAVAVAIVLLLVHVVGFVEALEIREARLRRRARLQAGGEEGGVYARSRGATARGRRRRRRGRSTWDDLCEPRACQSVSHGLRRRAHLQAGGREGYTL